MHAQPITTRFKWRQNHPSFQESPSAFWRHVQPTKSVYTCLNLIVSCHVIQVDSLCSQTEDDVPREVLYEESRKLEQNIDWLRLLLRHHQSHFKSTTFLSAHYCTWMTNFSCPTTSASIPRTPLSRYDRRESRHQLIDVYSTSVYISKHRRKFNFGFKVMLTDEYILPIRQLLFR